MTGGSSPAPEQALLATLRGIVGRRHVLTGDERTRPFATGYRHGSGPVLAVVRPASPLEQFRVFEACIAADVIVIVQAANTGLTGGSTPDGTYDRPVVIINTLRVGGVHLLADGRQVVCLAGATLYTLERRLAAIGREPHSVIGSSCIGASVVGGVCNNSGGALVQRGPAYTELALFARVTPDGRVELCNHLGIALGDDIDAMLARVEQGTFAPEDVAWDAGAASCPDYAGKVRAIGEGSPARYNADPAHLFEASGSAGKVMVLAVRLDTFATPHDTATFYVGTNDPAELDHLRRAILGQAETLPISGEYIHRTAFDTAARYGKDVFVAIERLGTDRLPMLYAIRNRIDGWARRLPFVPGNLADRLLQAASRLWPQHLPPRMRQWRDRYEHHLILKAADGGIADLQAILDRQFSASTGQYFTCTPQEARKAFLHRFAVAGAAVRYQAIHARTSGAMVALDLALRRDDREWLEHLPPHLAEQVDRALYYGHFLCHVFHQDYVLKPGVDPVAFEHALWAILDQRGARYPAEHNVGHLYPAGPELEAHYRALDPRNRLNPGLGQTSRKLCWH